MPLNALEGVAKRSVLAIQNYALLSGRALAGALQKPRYLSDMFTQADLIGVGK